jgi:hypothetical protein
LTKIQVVLALNRSDIAVGSVGEVPSHDDHLRIIDNVAGKQAVRCSRARLVRIPLYPFESRHCEDVYIIEPLEIIQNVPQAELEVMPTVAFSPKPNPP